MVSLLDVLSNSMKTITEVIDDGNYLASAYGDAFNGLLGGAPINLLIRSYRAIDTIVPNVVIQENVKDTLISTQHPVEKGASISDHAYSAPVEIDMIAGWSDAVGGYPGYSREMYDRLKTLQSLKEPFSVYTGKRVLNNMLLSVIDQTTDNKSEYSLIVRLMFKEAIIVSTETTSSGSSDGVAGTSKGETPATSSPVSIGGTKQLSTGIGSDYVAGGATDVVKQSTGIGSDYVASSYYTGGGF